MKRALHVRPVVLRWPRQKVGIGGAEVLAHVTAVGGAYYGGTGESVERDSEGVQPFLSPMTRHQCGFQAAASGCRQSVES